MRITGNFGNSYGYTNNTCRPEEKFSSLPERKQYKAVEDLVSFASGREYGGNKLQNLADQLGVRSPAHLSVALITASDKLDSVNAKSPIEELSDALGLRTDQIDCTLGKYVAEMAGYTGPGYGGGGGGNT